MRVTWVHPGARVAGRAPPGFPYGTHTPGGAGTDTRLAAGEAPPTRAGHHHRLSPEPPTRAGITTGAEPPTRGGTTHSGRTPQALAAKPHPVRVHIRVKR